ncbi:MAG: FtsX-like permease family protein [Chitinophagales bacterium]
MNLAFHIAKRYLISKKSTNAINVISSVSVMGMIVGTMALILVLSVFNGFEDLVTSLYNTFNPHIKITPQEGKVFVPDSSKVLQIEALPQVAAVSMVLEENALLQYREENNFIARLKGVDDHFTQVSQVDTSLIDGSFILEDGTIDYAVLGLGVQNILGVNIHNEFTPIKVYMPKRDVKVSQMRPETAFKQEIIYPSAVFAIQQDFDSRYAIVPMRFMRSLLNYDKEVSAIEIALKDEAQAAHVKKQIVAILGEGFDVKDRYEQDETLYKIMTAEKWVVYLILSFILIVASFNIIGSLSMLVIEKKHDIGILKAMGATKNFVRQVFFMEGVMLSLSGAIIGGTLATVICLIQQHFEVIKLQGASFLIDAYPVSMRIGDFVLVFVTVMVISVLASIVPAQRAAETSQLMKEE